MSIEIMSGVWRADLNTTHKIVLLSLADNANDSGMCWPSIPSIVKRTSLSERSVYNSLKFLEKIGIIERQKNNPNAASTLYKIDKDKILSTAPDAPLHDVHPAPDAPPPLHQMQPPPAPDAPKPSMNRKNESSNKKENNKKKKISDISKPELVSDQVWADFIQHRKEKKAPLTATALKGIEREAEKAGISTEEALIECCSRGWQGFKAEWFNKGENNHVRTNNEINGQGSQAHGQSSAAGYGRNHWPNQGAYGKAPGRESYERPKSAQERTREAFAIAIAKAEEEERIWREQQANKEH